MDETQRYWFDSQGYFVVPGVLDEAQLAHLKATMGPPTEQHDPGAKEENPLHWSESWRQLLDLPVLRPILESLVGNHELRRFRENRSGADFLPTYRLDHINVHQHVAKGFAGMDFHGGWTGAGGSQYFRYHDGEFYNGLIVVAFELFDTGANGGGFCCIPGSHKSNLPLPRDWVAKGGDAGGLVKGISARQGDAIIFTETLVHGTLPWTVDAPRQTAFYKFSPHGTSWTADYFDPEDFVQYEDMTDRQLALLEPPNARYAGRRTRPPRPSH
jgi:ectoine hydroxylase-related dioxygenase (phytanoyl-CoA dioxygenase family)